MAIEKNVCESIYDTLLHQLGMTKDGVKARKYLIELEIKRKLVPSGNKNSILTGPYTISKKKKKDILSNFV